MKYRADFVLLKRTVLGLMTRKALFFGRMIVDPEAANLINTNKREKQRSQKNGRGRIKEVERWDIRKGK